MYEKFEHIIFFNLHKNKLNIDGLHLGTTCPFTKSYLISRLFK